MLTRRARDDSDAVGSRVITGSTPGYLAPELTRGEPGDERADLYALGVTLRELGAQGSFAALAERLVRADVRARPSSLASACAQVSLELASDGAQHGRVAPLLGRSAQLAAAGSALVRVAAGESGPRVIWVEEVRGMGSTRFLRELCFAADERFALYASEAEREGVRALLTRVLGPAPNGVQGLVESVARSSQRCAPSLLAVPDADRAAATEEAELLLALAASDPSGKLAWLVSSTRPPPAQLMRVGCLHLQPDALELAELALWAGTLVPPSALPALRSYTGGFPLHVERILTSLPRAAFRQLRWTCAVGSCAPRATPPRPRCCSTWIRRSTRCWPSWHWACRPRAP